MAIVVKLVLKLKQWFSLEMEFSKSTKKAKEKRKKEGINNELPEPD